MIVVVDVVVVVVVAILKRNIWKKVKRYRYLPQIIIMTTLKENMRHLCAEHRYDIRELSQMNEACLRLTAKPIERQKAAL